MTTKKPECVISRDGKLTGEVIGQGHCRLEGCTGRTLTVRWNVPSPNTKHKTSITRPCTKGMRFKSENNSWTILN